MGERKYCVVCASYLGTLNSDLSPGTAMGWEDHVDLSHGEDQVLVAAARLVKGTAKAVWNAREALNG